jgi:adenylate kinase family enzyme
MKIVISLNGVDGSGKTTQAKLLYQQNPTLIEYIGGLENYPPYMNGLSKDFDWWFFNSTPIEFCDTIYESIYYRNLAIANSPKPIVIIDKGIRNFDARILSTLFIKGLNETESKILISNSKAKFKIKDYDNVSFFLSPTKEPSDRINVSLTREFSGLSQEKSQIYKRYQYYQNEIINNQLSLSEYAIIDASCSIEDVNLNLKKAIYICLKEKLLKPQTTIIGLGGLSESGKSSVGKYLSKNFDCWNLKLKYFVQIICQKYNIQDENEYFKNDILFTSFLEAEEICSFLKNHYYKKFASIESLHSKDLSLCLKDIFDSNFQIWYIDSYEENRILRNAKELEISVANSAYSVHEKDKIKCTRGANKVKTIADIIIENNDNIYSLFSYIDYIMGKYISCNYYSSTNNSFEINNVPKEYSEIIYKFCNSCKELLTNNLKLILLHGSCQRATVISGFSDIDLILVVKINDQKVRKILNKIINNCNTNIKIGTTVYSLDEILALHIDGKTLLALYKLKYKSISALYLANDISLPVIDYGMIIQRCKSALPEQIHTLRRLLYSQNCSDSYYDNLFKVTSHIMRMLLLICKIDPDSYEDVFQITATTYNLKPYNVHNFFGGDKKSIFQYSNYFADILQNL